MVDTAFGLTVPNYLLFQLNYPTLPHMCIPLPYSDIQAMGTVYNINSKFEVILCFELINAVLISLRGK